MNEYFVCFDGIDCYEENFVCGDNYKEIVTEVEKVLRSFGGGHADIFDEDGDFVEEIEV